MRALAKKPDDRFEHAADFARALEWAVQQEGLGYNDPTIVNDPLTPPTPFTPVQPPPALIEPVYPGGQQVNLMRTVTIQIENFAGGKLRFIKFFLFFITRKVFLAIVMAVILALYWGLLGQALASLLGTGTRIPWLPPGDVMFVLFTLGSFAIFLKYIFARK